MLIELNNSTYYFSDSYNFTVWITKGGKHIPISSDSFSKDYEKISYNQTLLDSLKENGFELEKLEELGRLSRDKSFTKVAKIFEDKYKEKSDRYIEALADARSFTSGGFESESLEGFKSTSLDSMEKALEGRKIFSLRYGAQAIIVRNLVNKDFASESVPQLHRGTNWIKKPKLDDDISFGDLGREFSSLDPTGNIFGTRDYIFIIKSPKSGANLSKFSNHPEESPWLINGNYKVTKIEGKRIYLK